MLSKTAGGLGALRWSSRRGGKKRADSGRGSCQRRAGESLIKPTFACRIVGNVIPAMPGGWGGLKRQVELSGVRSGGGCFRPWSFHLWVCPDPSPGWAGSTCPSAPEWHAWWICHRGAPWGRAAPHLHQSQSGYSSWMETPSPAWPSLRNPQLEPPDRKWRQFTLSLFTWQTYSIRFKKIKSPFKTDFFTQLINEFQNKGPFKQTEFSSYNQINVSVNSKHCCSFHQFQIKSKLSTTFCGT